MTDYRNIKIPDKDTKEYHYTQRRAEIYRLIKQKGDPEGLPTYQTLGDRYGVSHEQIRKDIIKIKEFIKDNIGKETKLRARTILDKAIEEKLDEEEYGEAFDLMMKWNKFLFKDEKTQVNIAQKFDGMSIEEKEKKLEEIVES